MKREVKLTGGEKNLEQKDYIQVTGLIFGVIAVLHVLRLILGWDANIGGYTVPIWVSFVAALIALYLAYSSQKLKK